MALPESSQNAMLDHLASISTHISLHTGDPSGGNELTGGSYARQSVTWNAASGSSLTQNGVANFDLTGVSAGTITHVGVYSALTGGVLRQSYDVTDRNFQPGDPARVQNLTVNQSSTG